MTPGVRKAITVHTGVVAAICLMALPLWILVGVPGTENSYARGWRIGLNTIMLYPLVWALASPVGRFLEDPSPSPDRHEGSVAAWIRLCACLCALLALVLSFVVMG